MPSSYHARRRPNIERRKDRFYAVLEVPSDLRERLGQMVKGQRKPRRRFVQSLGTGDIIIAERKARAYLDRWRADIARARGEGPGPNDDDAAQFRQALRDAGTPTERENVLERAWERAYEIGMENIGAHETPTDVPEAADFYGRATGIGFADFLTEWQAASRVTEKTKAMQAADIKRFAAKFPTISDVKKPEVKRWCLGLVVEGLTVKTVNRVLSALRPYWQHLQSIGQAPEGPSPFANLALGREQAGQVKDDKRKPFAPADVVKLETAARSRGDNDLADVILLAAYSGARIEEVCSLAIENVNLSHETPHIRIVAGKTEKAIREVPIHAELLPVFRRRIGERKTGYVLAGLIEAKFNRSDAVGKRFTTLKRNFKFNRQFVFHSIRKTVATLLEDAQVAENIAAAILGHHLGTMSYGLYSGGPSLATKAEAIAKLSYAVKA